VTKTHFNLYRSNILVKGEGRYLIAVRRMGATLLRQLEGDTIRNMEKRDRKR